MENSLRLISELQGDALRIGQAQVETLAGNRPRSSHFSSGSTGKQTREQQMLSPLCSPPLPPAYKASNPLAAKELTLVIVI